jgi:ATP-dependent DNA helicase RecG
MNKLEFTKKLNDLEWEDFEVKEAKGEVPKSSWETVSAFSNTSGGWIVFGVKQSGKHFEIKGVNNPEKIEQDFLNTLNGNKFNVHITTKQQRYNIDGKTVLAFYIPISSKKPVYFNSQANTFIRRGSADQRAKREEFDAMYRDQTFGTKTSETVEGTSKNDLNQTSVNRYRDYMSRFNPEVSYNRFDEDEFLQKLRVIEDGKCTYAGLLMLGKREVIEKHFPDFWIDLMEIPGTSYSDSSSRYTFRLDEYENLWEYYFECFARLKQKVDVTFTLTSEGFGQELSPGLVAIREALVNMLMHADYFSPAHPRIRIFTDHIEFYNPGGLPKPYEELREKDISLPRNPIIAKLFRMVKLAENAGFGFDKIETNWNKYNKTKPVYDLNFDSTIVKFTLEPSKKTTQETVEITVRDIPDKLMKVLVELGIEWSEKWSEKWSELSLRELQIIVLMLENPKISRTEISKKIDINSSAIQKQMKKLKEKQILKRIGPDKGGHWEIIN